MRIEELFSWVFFRHNTRIEFNSDGICRKVKYGSKVLSWIGTWKQYVLFVDTTDLFDMLLQRSRRIIIEVQRNSWQTWLYIKKSNKQILFTWLYCIIFDIIRMWKPKDGATLYMLPKIGVSQKSVSCLGERRLTFHFGSFWWIRKLRTVVLRYRKGLLKP